MKAGWFFVWVGCVGFCWLLLGFVVGLGGFLRGVFFDICWVGFCFYFFWGSGNVGRLRWLRQVVY